MTGNTSDNTRTCQNCNGLGEEVTASHSVGGRAENHREYGPCTRRGSNGR